MANRIPLLLVPGLLCTARLWRAQLESLPDVADMTVTTAQREYDDIGAIADVILGAAPENFALAGLSFGGYVALEIIRKASHRVARLALLDTSARPDTAAQRSRRGNTIEMARTGRFLGISDRLMPLFIHPERLTDQDLVAAVKKMALDVGRDGFLRQQTAILSRRDSRRALREIDCPTLVLVGQQDAATPPELSEEIAAGIADARLVVVEDCGHLSTMERPEQVNTAMRQWLSETA